MDRHNKKQCRHPRGRMLVPLLLIIALPVAAMIAIILYHKQAEPNPNTLPDAATAEISFGAVDWPVFRGDPQLTGLAAGNLPDALKLAWKFNTGGEILSAPVVAGDVVFVASLDKHLYALTLQTGTEIWRFEADDELEAAPLFCDGRVYIGSANGTFYALNATTGKVLWTFDEAGKITASANIARSGESGKTLIVFGSHDNNLYGLDTAGKTVLTAEADNYINGAVAVADNTAFFGSCDANVYMVPLGQPTAAETIDAGSYVAANPVITGGVVYAGNYDGRFFAADIATRKILWQYDETEDAFFSSPAVNDSVVVVGCRNGKLYCFDKTSGDVKWTFAATDNFDSSPVICGDKVIVGNDDGRVYLIDLTTGTEIFAYTLGSPVAGSAAIAKNHILIGCANGTLYAFTAK